ncbi:unnamed protein product [Bemisia tabaci]|uniref:JNK1/MAPK8-associated membrane protein n=1 Tax=Bemisia tabaci TaxID=7038 RepID=A0A9P0A440_BEMTA|nr:PREDICTED: JNK1/MAPK8-associated membrane protein [Bemisia tabaci]CAH0383632.1 unnamed protein product [Bemisia tabaci]
MVDKLSCPGVYCGRVLLSNGTYSSCGPCPRGFKANSSICEPCQGSPSFYDWLYLGFMVLVPLIFHWFCIGNKGHFRGSFSKGSLWLHFIALVEVALAAALTLFMVEPFGSFTIRSCPITNFADWYTLFYNPNPNYEIVLHCTQEAVYPLYTMVFIFYLLGIFMLLVVRPILVTLILDNYGKSSIYAGLYFYPFLGLLHAVYGGIIYYTFPYILIILSVISNAIHFAFKLDQSMKELVMSTITDVRNFVILMCHWMLHAYGLISITEMTNPIYHTALLSLVPFPALFYILTSKFSDPSNL